MVLMTKNILLFNALDDASEVLTDFLHKWGFRVEVINKNQIDNKQTTELKPLLIIFQFLEFSRSEFENFEYLKKEYNDVALIATSPYISIKNLVKVMQSGAADYLMQPYTPDDIQNVINKYSYSQT